MVPTDTDHQRSQMSPSTPPDPVTFFLPCDGYDSFTSGAYLTPDRLSSSSLGIIP